MRTAAEIIKMPIEDLKGMTQEDLIRFVQEAQEKLDLYKSQAEREKEFSSHIMSKYNALKNAIKNIGELAQ